MNACLSNTSEMTPETPAGEIQHFTGISSPYEIPLNPEIVLDTKFQTVEESARLIFDFYQKKIIN